MSSVRELEAKCSIERKQLMQYLLNYLVQEGVIAELQQETGTTSLGVSVMEPSIVLKGTNLQKIRLTAADSFGCGPGNFVRFQYEINLGRELSSEQIKKLNAVTRIIKEGKILKIFGGRAAEVKWVGQTLADLLNQDPSIGADLLNSAKSWGEIEVVIEASSSGDVIITGPRYSNPSMIVKLYDSEYKKEIQKGIFAYQTADKIAGHIRKVA